MERESAEACIKVSHWNAMGSVSEALNANTMIYISIIVSEAMLALCVIYSVETQD